MTDTCSFQPLKYNRARLAIMELIANNHLSVGDRLPAQNVLAETLDYSEITIRHALANMQASGLITRRKGSGTYLMRSPKDDVFQSHILNIYVDQPQCNRSGKGMFTLRRYFASRGIGMHDIVVTDYGLETINAARDSIGIIVHGWLTDNFLLQLQALGLPLVIAGNTSTSLDLPMVTTDLQLASQCLTKRLSQKGCKNIALFRGEAQYVSGDWAEAGYRNTIQELGATPLIVQPETRFDYANAIAEFMNWHPEVDGILMEHSTFIDFMAWNWTAPQKCYPKIGFLSTFPDKHYLHHCEHFLWVTFDDIMLHAGKMLLNHLINNTPLISCALPPIIQSAT